MSLLLSLLMLAPQARLDADYPPEALRQHWEGVSGIAATVGVDGRVHDCRIVQTSGHDVLDQAACAMLVRRARYRPALDAAGKPVASDVKMTIRWQLPHASETPPPN